MRAQDKNRNVNNYLDAVLATAVFYVYADLESDTIIEQSSDQPYGSSLCKWKIPPSNDLGGYSNLQLWICENLICQNKDTYLETSSSKNLIACFKRGEGRTATSFYILNDQEEVTLCWAVFYLHQTINLSNICVLCVIYDLTEQQKQERELENIRKELFLSRIRNSTGQIKPHFLYNALGSIQEVILEDPQRAASLLDDFTVHLRSCLKAIDSDKPILFSQEIENIRAYTNIEKMRFGDKLNVEFNLTATDFSILPLSIQPLVENAIRHGIYELADSSGTVVVSSLEDNETWIIEVKDTGVGFSVDEYEQKVQQGAIDSMGLKNIRLRLEKIMRASLEISSEVGSGTVATVRIPKERDAYASDYC